MLELRPVCENCGKSLPPNSTEAMICSFECTYCSTCVEQILHNVCPNCSGGLERRPIRPQKALVKNPPKNEPYLKPIDLDKFKPYREKYSIIKPEDR